MNGSMAQAVAEVTHLVGIATSSRKLLVAPGITGIPSSNKKLY